MHKNNANYIFHKKVFSFLQLINKILLVEMILFWFFKLQVKRFYKTKKKTYIKIYKFKALKDSTEFIETEVYMVFKE